MTAPCRRGLAHMLALHEVLERGDDCPQRVPTQGAFILHVLGCNECCIYYEVERPGTIEGFVRWLSIHVEGI